MNGKDKRKYYDSYKSFYNRLVREFSPKVEAAIREQIKFFADAYLTHNYITPDVIPSSIMRKALRRLYIVAGVSNANKVYRSIKRQIKSEDERSLKWTWVIAEYLKQNGLDKVSIDITNTLKDKIRAVIVDGVEKGYGTDKIVRNLKEADFPKWMAKRIVRTEMNKAANIGAMVAAADLNIAVNKEWLSATDNRTRRIPRNDYDHLHMNGIQVGFEERFIVPSTKVIDAMLFPGDPDASVGNLVNCRCTVVFVPIKDEQGQVVSMDRIPTTFEGDQDLVSSGNVATRPTSVFTRLLREVAQIEITRFLINQILGENEKD